MSMQGSQLRQGSLAEQRGAVPRTPGRGSPGGFLVLSLLVEGVTMLAFFAAAFLWCAIAAGRI